MKCPKTPLPNIGETFETDVDLPFKADGQIKKDEARWDSDNEVLISTWAD